MRKSQTHNPSVTQVVLKGTNLLSFFGPLTMGDHLRVRSGPYFPGEQLKLYMTSLLVNGNLSSIT